MQKKEIYKAGLVLGILSIPCGLLFAISGWVLGIIGIIMNSKKQNSANTTAGLVLSIIGLVLAVFNSIIGAVLTASQ